MVLVALALSNQRHRAMTASFAAGYALLAVGILGLTLRNALPEFFSVVLANCLIGAAVMSFWRGSRLMAGRLPRYRVEAGLIGLLFLTFNYFAFATPSSTARIIALSLFIVAGLWLCATELWDRAKAGRAVERLLVGVCLFGTLLTSLRTGLVLVHGGPPGLMQMRPGQAALFLLLPIVNYVTLAFGVIWYVLAKVNEELLAKSAALEKAKAEAERANRAKSGFLANMSHELRTPLNAIIGFSQIIKDGVMGPGRAVYAEYARDIFNAGEHLLAIINNVLDISKIEAGKTELHDEMIDPANLIDESIAAVRLQAETKDITLESAVPIGLPLIRGDTLRLRQVLINLLSNAVKFTERGRVTISAAFDVARGFEFVVADSGIGMSPEEITKSLEPFAQIENAISKKYAGTGLGLPLANGLVALHGGRLEIDSAKGSGTTITVRLPRERVLHSVREAAA